LVQRPLFNTAEIEVVANEMLASVFRNLLNNAVQHNDKDSPVVEITCDVHDEDVEIRIADNGPGIPDELKGSLFEEGKKGIESSGTGIGLYLVQTLVDQYGGDVWVSDNSPTGAVFHLQLPKAN
jgi:signal transduction histidine kinase